MKGFLLPIVRGGPMDNQRQEEGGGIVEPMVWFVGMFIVYVLL